MAKFLFHLWFLFSKNFSIKQERDEQDNLFNYDDLGIRRDSDLDEKKLSIYKVIFKKSNWNNLKNKINELKIFIYLVWKRPFLIFAAHT